MELRLTAEQEAQLAQIATTAGTEPERLARDVVARYLDDEARFHAAVREGIAQADRGEFINEAEMDARLEQMLALLMRIRWAPATAADLQNINDYLKEHHPHYRLPTTRRIYDAIRGTERLASARAVGKSRRHARSFVYAHTLYRRLSGKCKCNRGFAHLPWCAGPALRRRGDRSCGDRS